MPKEQRSTSKELNEEVGKIQQPIPAEEQFVADPAPIEIVEPGPVPQPPMEEATKEERAADLKEQSGYDPKANQPSKEEKAEFERREKELKGGK